MVASRCFSSSLTGVMTTYLGPCLVVFSESAIINPRDCGSDLQRHYLGPARRHIPRHLDALEHAAFPRAVLANPCRHGTDAIAQLRLGALAKGLLRLGVVGKRDFDFVAGVQMVDLAWLAHR